MIISESQGENYSTALSDGKSTVFADVAEEKGGKGQGMRPHDLLCAGLASCLNISTRMLLERKKLAYEKVIVRVDMDRSDEEKTKFLYDIEIVGDIPEETKRLISHMAANCPVRKTLSKEIEFEAISKA